MKEILDFYLRLSQNNNKPWFDEHRPEYEATKKKLCVIDSKGVSSFGDFIQALLDEGVAEAIYLDMGPGWNYSWYLDYDGVTHEIHKHRIIYTTNWITFYKL